MFLPILTCWNLEESKRQLRNSNSAETLCLRLSSGLFGNYLEFMEADSLSASNYGHAWHAHSFWGRRDENPGGSTSEHCSRRTPAGRSRARRGMRLSRRQREGRTIPPSPPVTMGMHGMPILFGAGGMRTLGVRPASTARAGRPQGEGEVLAEAELRLAAPLKRFRHGAYINSASLFCLTIHFCNYMYIL
jgi:hypothetical protein